MGEVHELRRATTSGSSVGGDSVPRMQITLRDLADDDLDALFLWEQDPRAVEMAAFTRADPSDREAFDAHLARILADPTTLNRAIEHSGRFVGTIASFPSELGREITYWVDPARWGRGIASAALMAFLELDPTRPLFARVAVHNLGSARVVQRAGFVPVGSDRGWADGVGREVDETVFRLG